MFRTIALVDCWSHDHWLEVNHEDPEIRSEDCGPGSHGFMLLDLHDERPDAAAMESAVGRMREALPDLMDGHGELRCAAAIDDAAWARLVGSAPAWMRRSAEANRASFPNRDHERDPAWLDLRTTDLDEALRMLDAARMPIVPSDRHGLGPDAPALRP
jgi:hypothetical protein